MVMVGVMVVMVWVVVLMVGVVVVVVGGGRGHGDSGGRWWSWSPAVAGVSFILTIKDCLKWFSSALNPAYSLLNLADQF